MPFITQLPHELWVIVSTFLYLGDIIAFADAIQGTPHIGLQQILKTAVIQDVYSFALKADVSGVLFMRGIDLSDELLNLCMTPGSYVRTAGPDRYVRPFRLYRVYLPSNNFVREFTLRRECQFAMTLNSCDRTFERVKAFEPHHDRTSTDEPVELMLRFLRTTEATTSAVLPRLHERSETFLLKFERVLGRPVRPANREPRSPFCRVRNVVQNLWLRKAIWSLDGDRLSLPLDWISPFFDEVRVTACFRKQRYYHTLEWPVVQSCLESVSISFDLLGFPPSQALRDFVVHEAVPESTREGSHGTNFGEI